MEEEKQLKKGVLYHYLPEIKKYKWLGIILFIGAILSAFFEFLIPYFFKNIIDSLTLEVREQAYTEALKWFWHLVCMYGAIWILWRVNDYTIVYYQAHAMRDMTCRCFQSIQKQSLQFFTDHFSGSLVKKVGRFVYSFESMFDIVFFNFIQQALILLIILGVFSYKSLILGGIFLIWALLFIILNYILARWKVPYDKAAAKEDSKVSGFLADSLGNYAGVKSSGGEKKESYLFSQVVDKWFQKTWFTWNLTVLINTIQAAFMLTFEAIIIYYALNLWKEEAFTIGEFVFLQSYLFLLFIKLWDFGRQIRVFYEKLADAQEMVDIFNRDLEVKDKSNAKKLKVTKGKIDILDISFSYKNTQEAFSQFSLKIASNEKIALVGHSGAGKSTLIKLLFRFYNIQKGSIAVDGQNIIEVTQESLRKNISLVPQDPVLFHRSIRENIAYGKDDATDEEVFSAAQKAYAHDFIIKLPNGYDTLVGERGVKLSGGEKQRIAIARAILENTKILVLDEATSALDSITEKEIQKAIANLMKDKTVIVVAHRLSTIKHVDRIIVLEDGKIMEEGKHEELLQKKGKYAELWSHQIGGFLID